MTRLLILIVALCVWTPQVRAEGPFSQSACWDEHCPEEVAACQENPVCALIAKCIQEGASVLTCFQEYDSVSASDLYTAIQECGWQACATNEGSCQGTCSYFGPTVCNCDPLCEQYGDCCMDYWDVCWEEPPPCDPACAGKTCGDDGCGGSCGTCLPNAACDASGQCNATCDPVCELGQTGCDGDVRWLCTAGPGGCPKKTTVDCAGASMICAHGECMAAPDVPDVVETQDASDGGDLDATDPELPPPSNPDSATDSASPKPDGPAISDAAAGSETPPAETLEDTAAAPPPAVSSTKGDGGCGGATGTGTPWPLGALVAWWACALALRRWRSGNRSVWSS